MVTIVSFIPSTNYDLGFVIYFLSVFGLVSLIVALHCRGCLWFLVKIFLYCFWLVSSVWAIISGSLLLAADGWLPSTYCLYFLCRQDFSVRWWEGSVPFLIQVLPISCALKYLWGLDCLHWRLLNSASCSGVYFSFELDVNWKGRKV